MSIEQSSQAEYLPSSFTEYADHTWYGSLVRMQNMDSWTDQPILLNGLFQQLCAESLIRELAKKPYFQKFGGRALALVMLPTDEPYMYNVGLRIISDEPK